jgi:hypothetical protein
MRVVFTGLKPCGEHSSHWCGPWFKVTGKICTPSLLEKSGSALEERSIILDRTHTAQTSPNRFKRLLARKPRLVPLTAALSPSPPVAAVKSPPVPGPDSKMSLSQSNGRFRLSSLLDVKLHLSARWLPREERNYASVVMPFEGFFALQGFRRTSRRHDILN